MSTRYSYDTTWRNLTPVINGDSTVLTTNTLDSLGRVVQSARKVPVQLSGSSVDVSWRRTLTTFDAANRVSVARAERSVSCSPNCDSLQYA